MQYILLFIFSLICWFVFTWTFTVTYFVIGAVIALLTAAIFGRYFLKNWKKVLNPIRYFWMVLYIPAFLWECIKANFDVAYRILHPALPIKPGIVKIKTNLKTDLAKVVLANSITMTPGTLTIDLIGNFLYIHWINVKSKNPAVYTEKIVRRYEKLIKRIFE